LLDLTTDMITVHHLNNSRSQRILWILEELNLPYEIKHYSRDPETMLAPKELEQVHPLGKSPVITEGDLTVAESGAIVEYIVEKHGPQLKPTDEKEKLLYTFWLHYAEGSLMGPLVMKLVFDAVVEKVPFLIRPIAKAIRGAVFEATVTPNLKKHFSFIESHLEKSEYFCGSKFSAADIQMSFGIQAGLDKTEFVGPKSKEWLKKVEAMDSYKKALEKGGPFSIL
jgi:glutathione S-transferase